MNGAKQKKEIERPLIGVGHRVGLLVVKEATPQRKNGYTVWRCRCECGNDVFLDTRCLQRATVTDCGCQTKVRPGMRDISGMRFGRLVALEATDKRLYSGSTVWRCRCDCGSICEVSLQQLTGGYTKSCGCLGHPPLKDYEGKRFGKLTVIAYAGKVDGLHRWRCLCDCGNEVTVGQTNLQSGKTRSCGCLRRKVRTVKPMKIDMRGHIAGTCVSILLARMNRAPIISNTSGYNGVYKNTNGKWAAQITFKNKTYYLGSFDDIRQAVAARKKGEEMYEDFLAWYYKEYPERMLGAFAAQNNNAAEG